MNSFTHTHTHTHTLSLSYCLKTNANRFRVRGCRRRAWCLCPQPESKQGICKYHTHTPHTPWSVLETEHFVGAFEDTIGWPRTTPVAKESARTSLLPLAMDCICMSKSCNRKDRTRSLSGKCRWSRRANPPLPPSLPQRQHRMRLAMLAMLRLRRVAALLLLEALPKPTQRR